MSALAADADREFYGSGLQPFPVEAGELIYLNALVMTDADGYLKPGADTAAHVFAGVAKQHVDNSAGADGALECVVDTRSPFEVAAESVTQAWLGLAVYLVDDQTVALAATTTNDVRVGKVVRVLSATRVVVDPLL